MKKIFQISASVLLPASTKKYAHHPAADFIDADSYTMASSFVADIPNAITGFLIKRVVVILDKV